jgi:hypothetical protein
MNWFMDWIHEGRQLRVDSEETRKEIARLLAELRDQEPAAAAYDRGLRDALRQAAGVADDLALGVAHPEKPYNEAFIHACGVVSRAIRDLPKGDT